MIATGVPILLTANAWERWYLGWLEPDSISADTTIRLYDFMETDTSLTRSLMIPVPHTHGQRLWLENHQLVRDWDEKGRYANPAFSLLDQGIYGFVSNDDLGDRASPALSPLDAGFANGLKPIHADGQHDFFINSDSLRGTSNLFGGNPIPAVERDSTYQRPNPFTGATPTFSLLFDEGNDQQLFYNSNLNNISGTALKDRASAYREFVNGIDVFTYAASGDTRMAFQTGDELSLTGNHPVVPLVEYSSVNQRNSPIAINGLEVKISTYYGDGSYDVHVRFGHYEVSGTQRWCGDLRLPDLGGDTLHVHQGDSILLDLSGTPDLADTALYDRVWMVDAEVVNVDLLNEQRIERGPPRCKPYNRIRRYAAWVSRIRANASKS